MLHHNIKAYGVPIEIRSIVVDKMQERAIAPWSGFILYIYVYIYISEILQGRLLHGKNAE